MNLRALIAAIYTLMLLWSLNDFLKVKTILTWEMASLMLRSLFYAFGGMLLAYWLYRDEETIESLRAKRKE